jgi:Protein of unknown function (DUF2971)
MPRRFDNEQVTALLDRIPTNLYKYSGLSGERLGWIQRLLIDSELYFASRTQFNDPLDCQIPPCFDASTLTIERFWADQIKSRVPDEDRRERKRRLAHYVRLSKTNKGREGLANEVLKPLDEHGIACFSAHPDKMLMWSYYAEGHSGVAIRFKITREYLLEMRSELSPIEIQYHKDFPRIDFYKATVDELIWGILGSKSEDWSHEAEWRLVAPNRTGYMRIPPSMIDAVILGMKIRPEHEAAIRAMAANRKIPTKVLRIRHKPNSFQLEVVAE